VKPVALVTAASRGMAADIARELHARGCYVVPMARYASVNEIAKTTAFLLSDGSSDITGQNIRVDGGLVRGP
jgi:NAD(P)-dependent dehydrogenase (short-subunit alcohol dehydrogenase family)